MRLFLCGDVMTGRGVDQILPHPGDPVLHEGYLRSALDYVGLAEAKAGPIPRNVSFEYIWGDALAEIELQGCDARIINLETAITTRGTPEPKGINYRMHPGNIGCILAAGIDCCVLANNHLGDWGPQGIDDTLATIAAAGLASAGAGSDQKAAWRPAIITPPRAGRVLVFAYGSPSAGVPGHWAAGPGQAGVNFLEDLGDDAATEVGRHIDEWRRPGDVVVVSIHWGPNWGYHIPASHRRFARRLIESGSADIIHGHSSHHPIGIEVIAGKPVIYGCGDFINDYEGIGGHEAYRPDLALGYFVQTDEGGRLAELEMVPFRMRRFRLDRAAHSERLWLAAALQRECRGFGHRVVLNERGSLALRW